MTILQILIIVFALFALSRAILRFKDKKISIFEFGLWTLIWGAIIVTVIIPKTATLISNFFGISRPIDLAVYVSILLLFYLVFRLYVHLEMQRQEITKVVREKAKKHPRKK